jgi:putative colanic acid biosynthesis UDP-glucose lipid carrier transferase
MNTSRIEDHSLSFIKQYSLEDRHLLFFIADFIIIIGSSFLAYYLVYQHLDISFNYKIIIVINTLLILLSSSFYRLYRSWRGLIFFGQLYKVFSVWFVSFACLFVLLFFSKQSPSFSIIWFQVWFVIGAGFTCLYRTLSIIFLNKLRQQGKNIKEVIIVGNGKIIKDITRVSKQHPEYGFKVIQFMKLSHLTPPDDIIYQKLVDTLSMNEKAELWICLPLADSFIIKKILNNLRYSTVEIRFFPDLEDLKILNYDATNLMGFHSLNLSCSSITDTKSSVKRYEDVVLSLIILALISVPCLVIILGIKLTSRGPVLFKQKRHGAKKQIFDVYKFRSMTVSRENSNVTQATKNDARITKFGGFLRKTSLDELPQFINVLQGNMSIVGPRPHALSHNEQYKSLVQTYMWRHKVKPGITGWAQINGYRGETDTLDKMQKRVEFDLWYIENWSLFLDLRIVFLTIFKGFINKNAY